MTMIKKDGHWVTVAGGQRMWVGTKAQLNAALAAGELEDGTAVMVTDDYEENIPVGVVQAYMGITAPNGWLLCDGSTFDINMYPKLYALLGKDTVPDLRECVMVGAGQSTRAILDTAGHEHDVYTLGEFKDDQIQDHTHSSKGATSSGSSRILDTSSYNTYTNINTGTVTANAGYRTGTTTHGKQLGVNYIIRAA